MAVMLIGVVVQVLFITAGCRNRSTHYNINHYKTMVEQLNERASYCVKDYEDKLTADIPFTETAIRSACFPPS
ncbi:MAG: hypothetical protein ACLRSW_04050 [Christensenellaceae bacterium]